MSPVPRWPPPQGVQGKICLLGVAQCPPPQLRTCLRAGVGCVHGAVPCAVVTCDFSTRVRGAFPMGAGHPCVPRVCLVCASCVPGRSPWDLGGGMAALSGCPSPMAMALAWALAPHPSHNSVFSVSIVLVRACGNESRDGFNGCFLMINDVEHSFLYLSAV